MRNKIALLPHNHLLQLHPKVIQDIKNIYNLGQPRRLDESIDILEQWIKKQDHILKKDFARDYLERTLIANKGLVERAKKKIDKLCTMKTLLPHYFSVSNVKVELKQMADLAFFVPLPKVTKDYYRILLLKIFDRKYTEQDYLMYYQYNVIVYEYLRAHDYVNGYILIEDYRLTNLMELLTKMNSVELLEFTTLVIEGFGARIKGIHLLSNSNLIVMLLKILKQLLSQKMLNRTYVHKTLEDLHAAVPRELLSLEYGGNERSDWIEELSTEDHVNYMKMMNKASTNEELRRSDQFNEEYMGMPGTFRNLRVD